MIRQYFVEVSVLFELLRARRRVRLAEAYIKGQRHCCVLTVRVVPWNPAIIPCFCCPPGIILLEASAMLLVHYSEVRTPNAFHMSVV